MRAIFAALGLVLAVSTAQAQDHAGIGQTIESQIAALQADDFDRAFSFASPDIKRLFATPERFGAMVRNGYPMVYRPADVTMLEQTETPAGVVQRVMIRDAQGRLHFLAYQMVPAADGWQINGVQLLQAPETGV
ncbi:DUF4864 domain-containing protein [Roseinatronobacter alkalisoli]|uniref:DUF4864 domain-containing protein n=1 Tax=Roseinatronobacter alkalisoli TaxID=3028235 RepID=A0ABT5TDH9_9RHOB|nr:DUF4864 domain-containing protein [Roseinatronobacter sp. HJB301]MDD7973177.1 DUF4864 domain-containing protein [Roseinatronobacter sp. HJB301]